MVIVQRCLHCFDRLVAGLPCSGCASVSFCSPACHQVALQSYHRLECGHQYLLGAGANQVLGADYADGVNHAHGANHSEGANHAHGANHADGANKAQGANHADGANPAHGDNHADGGNHAHGASHGDGANHSLRSDTLQGEKLLQGANLLALR